MINKTIINTIVKAIQFIHLFFYLKVTSKYRSVFNCKNDKNYLVKNGGLFDCLTNRAKIYEIYLNKNY